MLGTAVILPVWCWVWRRLVWKSLCAEAAWQPGVERFEREQAFERDHWWCMLHDAPPTTPNPSITHYHVHCWKTEMKGPPLLVVGETQLPSMGRWLLKHTSRLLARIAPTYAPLVVAACNQLHNWILLVNIHLDIGFSLPNNIPPTTVSFTCFLYESNLIPQS